MGMKVRTRQVPLDFLGEEWQDAYIDFRRGHWRDMEVVDEIQKNQKGTQAIIAMLEHMFHSGQVPDESGKLVEMTKENLSEFDNEALVDISDHMMETADPKAPASLSPTSSEAEDDLSGSSDLSTENASDSPAKS